MSEQRPIPVPRTQTVRESLRKALTGEPKDVRELSQAVGISERDVLEHLAHLEKSVSGRGSRLHRVPPRCLACDFVFAERARLSRPGRCPRCKSTRITSPRFRLE